jgi:hypothetical protein
MPWISNGCSQQSHNCTVYLNGDRLPRAQPASGLPKIYADIENTIERYQLPMLVPRVFQNGDGL